MVAALMSSTIRQFSFAIVFVATLGPYAAAQPPSLGQPSLVQPSPEQPSLGQTSFAPPNFGQSNLGLASVEPQQGVLALRSGGVIAGRYSKVGDLYVVAVNGGEIRIDANKVEVACQSIQQAYQLKRTAISQHSVSSHLRLAQWCIRQKLFQQAAAEINTARDIDVGDRRIALIERRLQAVQYQVATARKITNQPAPIPDRAELERWLDGLPRKSVEQFANSIQPLLSNRCATGACHGPTSSRADVHVLRVPRGRSVSRRATARNLREIMKWVDREQPGDSPLLAVPARPHANAEAAIFFLGGHSSGGDEQYRRLVDWVYSLSQQPEGTVPMRDAQDVARPFADAPVMRSAWGTASPLLQPTIVPGRTSPRVSPSRTPVHHALAERRQALEAAAAADPAVRNETPNDLTQRARKQEGDKSARAAGSGAGGYVPIDEFDPEIFNRRHPPTPVDEP
jgi:hypothetical protein